MRFIPAFILRYIGHRPNLVNIVENMGWLFFDKILRMGVGLLVGVWVARYLGPIGFGQFNFAVAFVGLFGAIAGLGLNSIVVRDVVRDPLSASQTVGTAFVMQALAGFLAMLLAILGIAILKPEEELTRFLVIIISISLLFKATDVIKYWFEARVQSRNVILIENGVFIFMVIVRVALILSKATLIAFTWVILIEALMISIGLIFIYVQKEAFHGLFRMNFNRAKILMNDAWPLLFSAITVTLYMRIDMIMLEAMANTREVGIYAAATRVSEIGYLLPTIIISSISPSLIACYINDKSLYLMRLRGLYFIMFWLSLFVTISISLMSEQIINFLYGTDYSGAALVLKIHLWASLAVFLGMASSQYLLVEQLQIISFYRTLIGLIFNVLMNIILIPEMGANGAAIATVVSYLIATFSLILFKKTRVHALYLLLSPIPIKKPHTL